MRLNRRELLGASIGLLAFESGCRRRAVVTDGVGAEAETNSQIDEANELFLRGNYKDALAKYVELASGQPDNQDLAIAIAACHARVGDFDGASQCLTAVTPESPDDLAFCAFVRARARDFDAAQRAVATIPEAEVSADCELLEAIAEAAARSGNRAEAWRYYRRIQKQNPSSAAIDRLAESGFFDFSSDFFGYGPRSLLNYSKGFGSGVLGWTVDIVQGLWQLLRHPIDTATSVAAGIAEICSPENLKLLLSPGELAGAIGDLASRLYWSAWEACKLSAAREFGLDADRFEDQQPIHEIAAGRMFGYVTPEFVLLVLSAGAGTAAKASKAERIAEAAKTIGQTEQRLEKVNQVARSAQFLADAEKLPQLRSLHWLSDVTWEVLKGSPRIATRAEKVVGWMKAVRHVPGAGSLVKTIASRLHLDDVDGYLYQLARAAAYAKEEKLAEIGSRFRVAVARRGFPVKLMMAEADLALTDGTLVETKLRKGTLVLDEKLHIQLLKYDRAVAEGKFKRIRIECNGSVAQPLRDRCNVIASRGIPIEIAENIGFDP